MNGENATENGIAGTMTTTELEVLLPNLYCELLSTPICLVASDY